jgi:hypothetical protein
MPLGVAGTAAGVVGVAVGVAAVGDRVDWALGLAAGAVVGTALAATTPWYGYGYGYPYGYGYGYGYPSYAYGYGYPAWGAGVRGGAQGHAFWLCLQARVPIRLQARRPIRCAASHLCVGPAIPLGSLGVSALVTTNIGAV